MAYLWKLTAVEAQRQILRGEVLLERYVASLLERIASRDAAVQAWAHLDRAQALSEARRLDQILPHKRGPLHGFAVGVKDVFLTKDMPTAYNSPIFRDAPIQTVDAAPVTVLRALGALLLGKTHTTEFAMSMDGPATRNPHNGQHTPGGSSSGSGAAVADFQVPLALGTQTLGSVVRPASYNGCYGYKATWGAVSREGLGMASPTLDTFGILGRSIDDLDVLADMFRLADDDAPPKTPFSLSGARVGFCQTPVWAQAATPALETAWAQAKTILAQHGAVVEDVTLADDFAQIPAWHRTVVLGECGPSYLGHYTLDKEKLHPDLVAYVEGPRPTHRELLAAYDGCARLRPVFDKIAAQYDVVLTPSAPDEAPAGTKTGDGRFCLTWSILHVPVVHVPGFSGSTGLPLGLSLVGPRYTDRKVLRAAKTIGHVFEKEGGWKHNLF